MTDVLCLDANIYVKVVVEADPPELTIAARRLIGRVEAGTIALVAPAAHYNLPTLYDASFLACTEMAPAEEPGGREFWTADDTLLHQFGDRRPPYVRRLGE